MDLADLISQANASSKLITESAPQITDLRQTQKDLNDNQVNLQLDIGAANATIERAKQLASLAEQNARQKAGAITGADLNQQTEVLTNATALFHKSYQDQLAARQAIQEKDSVQFLDNPLQFIVNQFTVNDDIDRYNKALADKQTAQLYINQVNAMGDAMAKTQANFKQSLTQATIDAEVDKATKLAQVEANKTKIQGIEYNIAALKEAIDMDSKKLGILFNVDQASRAQQQLKLAMDSFALHQQEFEWKKEAVADQKAVDEMDIQRIQDGLIQMYGTKAPNILASPKLAKQYLALMRTKGPAGLEAQTAYMAGQTGIIGGNAAQVIDMVNKGVGIQFKPEQEPLKQVFNDAVNEARAQAAMIKNDADRQDFINKSVDKKIRDMLREVKPGDGNNLFQIGATSDLAALPGVRDSALVKNVLGPEMQAGAKLDDPGQVFESTLKAVQTGKIKLQQAVDDLATMYAKGVETNLATRNLTKFGVVIDPSSGDGSGKADLFRSYNVRIKTNVLSPFGGEIVNVANRDELLRAANKALASRMFLQSGWGSL